MNQVNGITIMNEQDIENLVRDLLAGFKASVGGTITEDQAYAFEAGVRSALATIRAD